MKILFSNINSFLDKKSQLSEVVDSCLPDIICLNETLLTDTSVVKEFKTRFRKYTKNFNILKNSNVNTNNIQNQIAFRGISILSLDDIDISYLTKTSEYEIIIAQIVHKNMNYKLILSYLSPSIKDKQKIENFYANLISEVNLTPKNTKVLIIGDLNSKDNAIFPTKSANYAGKILYNFLNNIPFGKNNASLNRFMENQVNHITRSNPDNTGGNLLDLVITDRKLKNCNIQHVDRLSDHDTLLVNLSPEKLNTEVPKIKTLCYNYEKADLIGLGEELKRVNLKLENDLSEIFSSCPTTKYKTIKRSASSKIDRTVKSLEENLNKAFMKFVPNKIREVPADQEFDTFLPATVKNLLNKKIHLYNKLREKDKNPNRDFDYINLKIDYENAKEKFKMKWLEELETPKYGKDKQYYSKISYLLGKGNTKSMIQLNDEKGNPINLEKIPDIFAKTFENKLKIDKNNPISKRFKNIAIRNSMKEFDTTTNQIYDIIKNLNNKLSSGLDKINNKLLKLCPWEMAKIISTLTNVIFKTNHWPSPFKTALAIPIHKKLSKFDPNSYRIIALLSCLSKVIERVIANQLVDYLESNKLLFFRQHGYRTNHNTNHLTADLIDELLRNKSDKKLCSVLFIDFTAAFDLMPIDRMIEKLRGYGATKNQQLLLGSYLRGRKYRFEVNGIRSRDCNLEAGVPQGSVLGPLLWLIYINDLPLIDENPNFHFLFADDVASINTAKSKWELTEKTNRTGKRLGEWATKNGCTISMKKTKIMSFGVKDLGCIHIRGGK